MYLLVVVGIAAIGGLWPALAAAVVSSLLTNYFFVPPIHTWTISEPEHLFAIFVFVAVAAVVSGLVNRAARLRVEAQRGRAEAEALAHLAGWLVSDEDPLPGLVEHVRTTFGLDAVSVLRVATDGGWIVEASAGVGRALHSRPRDGDARSRRGLVARDPRVRGYRRRPGACSPRSSRSSRSPSAPAR